MSAEPSLFTPGAINPDYNAMNIRALGAQYNDIYGALNEAETRASRSRAGYATVYVPPGQWTLPRTKSLSSTVRLVMDYNAYITVASGATFTINSPFDAPGYQIFDVGSGVGTTVIAKPSGFGVMPQWWGALGNNSHDDTNGINAATTATDTVAVGGGATAGARMYFPAGKYLTTAALTAPGNNVVIEGVGFSRSTNPLPAVVIKSSLTTTAMWDWGAASGVILRNICLQGSAGSGNKDAHCITGSNINNSTFNEVQILQFGGSAIRLAGSNNHLKDCQFTSCNSDYANLADYQGTVHITSGENWMENVEAAGGLTSTTHTSYGSGYACAFYIAASQVRCYNCVGEFGQNGWVLNGGGDWSYFNYCRGEGCQGSGWKIIAVKNQLTDCHANSNSLDTDNTYDAFDVESGSNFLNNCVAGPSGTSFKPRYGFTDNYGSAADTVAFANVYANCRAEFGVNGRTFNITGAVKAIITPNPHEQKTSATANSDGSYAFDGEKGDTFFLTIPTSTSQTATVTATNLIQGHDYKLIVFNNSGTSQTVTLSTGFSKVTGFSSPANGKYRYATMNCYNGTDLIGSSSGDI